VAVALVGERTNSECQADCLTQNLRPFFSIGPKYSNVAYKAKLSSRAMTDKMAAVVSFCEVMGHRHHPLWVAKGRKDTPEIFVSIFRLQLNSDYFNAEFFTFRKKKKTNLQRRNN
jgi:hypothetical protein